MTGDHLHQAADALNQATAALRKSVTIQHTTVAGTEPAAGHARDPIGELRIQTLTRREREFLGLLANGWSNRRIANQCLLSPKRSAPGCRTSWSSWASTPSWKPWSSRSTTAWCRPRGSVVPDNLMGVLATGEAARVGETTGGGPW
jgi:Bacterial regulatory proteins, luxR family